MINTHACSYTYPLAAAPALRDVTLSIAAGELVAVLGANDSGKSTLCYALSGLAPQFFRGQMTGRVTVADLDTQRTPLGALMAVAGVMLQNPVNQISGARFTVAEEVAFGLENLGVPRAAMQARVTETLRLLGLEELAAASPWALSGGQQQRLALAATLAMQPPVLLLDEPTSHLDAASSRAVWQVLHSLSRSGRTVVVVERNLVLVAEFADRLLVLDTGAIVLDGPPRAVLTDARLEHWQVGRARVTRLAEQAQAEDLWPTTRALPLTVNEAVAGFRSGGHDGNRS